MTMKCRHCHAEVTLPFVDLGSSPPSNAYLTPVQMQQPETVYPLRVLVCEQCWLVQTEDFAGFDTMFSPDYAYFSSFSSSWLAHAKVYCEELTTRLGINAASCAPAPRRSGEAVGAADPDRRREGLAGGGCRLDLARDVGERRRHRAPRQHRCCRPVDWHRVD